MATVVIEVGAITTADTMKMLPLPVMTVPQVRIFYISINQSINKFIAGNKAHKHTDTQTNRKTDTHIQK